MYPTKPAIIKKTPLRYLVPYLFQFFRVVYNDENDRNFFLLLHNITHKLPNNQYEKIHFGDCNFGDDSMVEWLVVTIIIIASKNIITHW